ncbi:AraC family transcriptional regulator [Lacrimispora sp. NSJ-141]|uniref:AraC family transcriptional regulator n=1 Tax=Lientehia hominis TaxID=2897778 RepID=A0AAP2RG29_9FIRM|nr:AraC family transcriptional regulator [Lientehia hominis]MCD2491579.1 AraC family transcriptional regulator [Lientehia hominis]
MEEILKNGGLTLLAKSDGCAVYQLKNETGDGTMAFYEVLPGVSLIFNDLHISSWESNFHTTEDLFCIDHCREGRLEYEAGQDVFSYVEAGDVKLDRRIKHSGHFSLPLSHYHGITVSFHLPEAAGPVSEAIPEYHMDLYSVQKKYCSESHPMILHNAPSIGHIFSELYDVPAAIKPQYFRLKVMELLLFLDAMECPDAHVQPYFYRSHVEKIKAMYALMTGDLEHHYTMEYLSLHFDIPLTTMKNCFKGMFGCPINTYMRTYRMKQAAVMLRDRRELSVAEVSGLVGYDSASKFAAAFKDVMGRTPLEYRNN